MISDYFKKGGKEVIEFFKTCFSLIFYVYLQTIQTSEYISSSRVYFKEGFTSNLLAS